MIRFPEGVRSKAFLSIMMLLAGLFIHTTTFAEAAIIHLGSLWPGSSDGGGYALGLSDDGTVAIGRSTKQSTEDSVAFRWDEPTLMKSSG